MKIHVATRNPLKVRATRAGFGLAFPAVPLEVSAVAVRSPVPPQPFDEAVARGAIARARLAVEGADFGVGIEAGVVRFPGYDEPLSAQFCAIVDASGRLTVGHGPGYALPASVLAALRAGSTLNREASALAGVDEIKEKSGAIGVLSGGRIERFAITREAVLMALVPRLGEPPFGESSSELPTRTV